MPRQAKNSVSIVNNHGNIKLKWRIGVKQVTLSPGLRYEPANIKIATGYAAIIESDIKSGNYDPTLERYKLAFNPKSQYLGIVNEPKKLVKFKDSVLSYFQDWIQSLQLNERTYYGHYASLESWIEKNNLTFESLPNALKGQSDWSSSTFNERLRHLKRFVDELIKEGKTDFKENPLNKVKKKEKTEKRYPRDVFTEDEIKLILEAIKTNQFCKLKSAYKHSHYYNFYRFLFTYGVRPQEAIGLRWSDIDLKGRRINITTVLARSAKGLSHSSARVRKPTKSGNKKILPLDEYWLDFFSTHAKNHSPDELVFTSHKGNAVDDKMLSRRLYKPVLEALGIPYRNHYAARHTFGTMAVEQGIPLTQVSALMGHSNIETTMRNYVHKTEAVTLPKLV